MHITFICTGNTCRSPMAEGIAEKILAEKYSNCDITVSSAGVSASNGTPPSENAVIVCKEFGIDISGYKSKSLSHETISITDIFTVMTKSHAEILKLYGIPEEKITILGNGIPDPFGGNIEIYRNCRNVIIGAVEDLLTSVADKN